MPRTSSPDGLADLLEQQSSVVSRAQLLTLGMKDTAMQHRVRVGGPWRVLLPGVYVAANGVPSVSQKEMAALLYAGQGSLITGSMALMHHSIRSGSAFDGAIDVLVPADRQRLSTGFAPAAQDSQDAHPSLLQRSGAADTGAPRRGGHRPAAHRTT
jgi:hypothetical protein